MLWSVLEVLISWWVWDSDTIHTCYFYHTEFVNLFFFLRELINTTGVLCCHRMLHLSLQQKPGGPVLLLGGLRLKQ